MWAFLQLFHVSLESLDPQGVCIYMPQTRVRELEAHGMHFCHPFDDPLLIVAYGTIGLEILEVGCGPS